MRERWRPARAPSHPMRAFSELYDELDATRSTNRKIEAMARYFRAAPPGDASWAAYILSGRRLKRFLGPSLLWRWLIAASGLPEWLVEESYARVGDLAETIALLVPRAAERTVAVSDTALADWIEERLLPLRGETEEHQRAQIIGWWRSLAPRECYLLNKLLTGELRVGVSETLLVRALSQVLELPRAEVSRRLMGEWLPSAGFWRALGSGAHAAAPPSSPYPFFLASPLEGEPQSLGEPSEWLAEWKWDGIRGQLVRRGGQCFLWSRGEELVTERFPEIAGAAVALPEGTVLDGEILAWREGRVRPFAELQTRIGRKKLTPSILERVPARFLAFDLLEQNGQDIRTLALAQRRARLEKLVSALPREVIGTSPVIERGSWDELARLRSESRARGVEGMVLKARASAYGSGRERGAWWKWKIDPYSFDAVMLYAQPGHGRRSSLYTDYTFGVWRNGELVPVAKAYSGLTDAEILELDAWILAHTVEKFGPVRRVEPTQVFELAFEGIAPSGRHRSGIALRFPRILRRRTDKSAAQADSVETLRALLEVREPGS